MIVRPFADKAVQEISLPLRHEDIIRQQAADKGLDPSLIAGVIYAESRFRDQTSHAGAKGLMQILPSTADYIAAQVGRHARSSRATSRPRRSTSPTAPGTCATCCEHYHGNELLALAAYNAGEGKVDEWYREASARGEDFEVADAHPVPRDAQLRRLGARGARALPPASTGRSWDLMNERRLGRTGLQRLRDRLRRLGHRRRHVARRARTTSRCAALHRAIDLGAELHRHRARLRATGTREQLVGQVVRERDERIVVASKIPPKNLRWPAPDGIDPDEAFPADHVRKCTERSLNNLGMDAIDVQQFHVWNDEWVGRGELAARRSRR